MNEAATINLILELVQDSIDEELREIERAKHEIKLARQSLDYWLHEIEQAENKLSQKTRRRSALIKEWLKGQDEVTHE